MHLAHLPVPDVLAAAGAIHLADDHDPAPVSVAAIHHLDRHSLSSHALTILEHPGSVIDSGIIDAAVDTCGPAHASIALELLCPDPDPAAAAALGTAIRTNGATPSHPCIAGWSFLDTDAVDNDILLHAPTLAHRRLAKARTEAHHRILHGETFQAVSDYAHTLNWTIARGREMARVVASAPAFPPLRHYTALRHELLDADDDAFRAFVHDYDAFTT